MQSMDDAQLEAVFKSCYEKYKKTVYARFKKRLARYHVPDKTAQAQDLLQDTFAGLFRWMKKYVEDHRQLPSSESLEKVLFTVDIRVFLKYYHKHLKAKIPIIPYPRN